MAQTATNYIGSRVRMTNKVFVGAGTAILGPTTVGDDTIIEDHCLIGKPSNPNIKEARESGWLPRSFADFDSRVVKKCVIGSRTYISRGSTICEGSEIGSDSLLMENTYVGWETTLGEGCRIMFSALIHSWARIGSRCRIGGFVCNDARVGDYVTLMGSLVHKYTLYGSGRRPPAPQLGNRITVAFGAVVVGGISIGDYSYITPGAIVTHDVPPKTVVTGFNMCTPLERWKGDLGEDYMKSFG